MKLVFFGGCMFGRDGHDFVSDPFVHVKHIIKEASCLFFNLETTISVPLLHDDYKEEKKFNYQATDEQLRSLRKITKKTTFVSFANNHALDYGPKGFENTRNILKELKFLTKPKHKVESKGIVFLNATDHCGCKDEELWKQYLLWIDYKNVEPILQRVRNLKNKFIVFSVHWGPNYIDGDMPEHIQNFAKQLIDAGVNIVFGHSAHHIVKDPVQMYSGGMIIYGLGDFINDYMVNKEYQGDNALICVVEKKGTKLTPKVIPVKRTFVADKSSIPIPA